MEKTGLSAESYALLSRTDKLFPAFLDRHRHSTLGSLVKGIIHNLNGSLQVLSAQLELLQGGLLKEGEKINPSLNVKTGQCLEQLDKLKAMVETLMEKGAHDDQEGTQPIHLNDLLEEELALLHHNLFFKHHIKVVKSFSRPLPPLKGYYLDFSQGLANLIQNAIEAMEKTPVKELAVETLARDDQVRVIIRDTGCGISEEVKPDLFKPFCGRKGGKHHGLGLFISQVLLTPYGASFSYSSRAGQTTFSVHFPTSLGRAN
jgi:C4-dicarboxylate-specific signal transduction histidine kinase